MSYTDQITSQMSRLSLDEDISSSSCPETGEVRWLELADPLKMSVVTSESRSSYLAFTATCRVLEHDRFHYFVINNPQAITKIFQEKVECLDCVDILKALSSLKIYPHIPIQLTVTLKHGLIKPLTLLASKFPQLKLAVADPDSEVGGLGGCVSNLYLNAGVWNSGSKLNELFSKCPNVEVMHFTAIETRFVQVDCQFPQSLVELQLTQKGISDQAILELFKRLPKLQFVSEHVRDIVHVMMREIIEGACVLKYVEMKEARNIVLLVDDSDSEYEI